VAVITGGTKVAVIAGGAVQFVGTPAAGITRICGAEVVVITNDERIEGALSPVTMVSIGARVAVVARSCTRCVQATARRLTRIYGAGAGIVAVNRLPSLAYPLFAGVSRGADVPVFAGSGVGSIGASVRLVTAIIRAGIAVVAVHLLATLALPFKAARCDGAAVAVIAELSIWRSEGLALSRQLVAGGLIALRRFALKGRTGHHRFSGYPALIGKGRGVAIEGPVAEVVIFKLSAVSIALAIALQGKPEALTLVTFVGHGALVAVVTVGAVVFIETTAQAVTRIVSARIVVVAIDGSTDTLSFLAVVTNGASVTVDALSSLKVHLLTAIGAEAGIH